ncbi:MAG TPA: TetR/AcrR family transcriptional regulator [Xanthobacteraceae bacterium]|nr:TetR/AcrR family transcriptional regulator [Xanthobacteraceae bacterium]
MGRPARFTKTGLIDAATTLSARLGPARVTVAGIAREAGAPVGSVYHRYPSQGALLAEVWLAAAERFQSAALALVAKARNEDDAVECALVTPRFVRSDHATAVVLMTHRRDDFLSPGIPKEYRDRAAKLAADMRTGLATAAARLLPSDPRGREKLAVALIGIPLGAVRIFLPQAVPPPEIDATIAAAVRAALKAP